MYQYSIADEVRTKFGSCASIKDKLHSMSAMEGAQNRRLENAGSKDGWLIGLAGRCWRVEQPWHRTIKGDCFHSETHSQIGSSLGSTVVKGSAWTASGIS